MIIYKFYDFFSSVKNTLDILKAIALNLYMSCLCGHLNSINILTILTFIQGHGIGLHSFLTSSISFITIL